MKLMLIALLGAIITTSMHAQTLQWGNEALSMVTDSQGNEANDVNGFMFELGAFTPGFSPLTGDINDWRSNWNVFDVADYETDLESGGAGGVFTSTVNIIDVSGKVSSSYPGASTIDFSGLDAYLWISKGTDPIAGTEWLLVRAASDWTFPTILGGCCDLTDWQWSSSQLLAEGSTPLWGRQHSVLGDGEYTLNSSGSSTLQTFTFIPEPSVALMGVVAAMGMVLRRRRASAA